jgi:hypothetical protein
MSRVFSKSDILDLIIAERRKSGEPVSEIDEVPSTLGDEGDEISLIGKGFKIRHRDSGYTYTCVRQIDNGESSILIVKDDGVGDYYAIPSEDLSKYERM